MRGLVSPPLSSELECNMIGGCCDDDNIDDGRVEGHVTGGQIH